MCINVEIDEIGREKLGIATCVVCGGLTIFGVIVMALSFFIKTTIDDRMVLLSGYDAAVLPSFLLSVAIMLIVTNLILAKVAYDCGYAETRGRFQNLLVLFLMYLFVMIWVVFAGSMLCFSHRVEIKEALGNGILGLMTRYHKDQNIKLLIDRMQLDYKCCGSHSYQDWFRVHWIDNKYVDDRAHQIRSRMRGGKFIIDSAPFSCCDYTSPRPCIHNNVLNHGLHVRPVLTLYKHGCKKVLKDFFDNVVLEPCGYFILACFFLQIAVMMMLRLMQTSILNACDMEDPYGVGIGYIIPDCPCETCRTGDPMKYVKHIKNKNKLEKIEAKKKKKEGVLDRDDSESGGDDGGLVDDVGGALDEFGDFGGGEGDAGGDGDDGGGDDGGGGGDDGGGGGGDGGGKDKKKKDKNKKDKKKSKKDKKKKKGKDKKKKKSGKKKTKKKKSPKKKKMKRSKKKSGGKKGGRKGGKKGGRKGGRRGGKRR